MDTRLRGDDTLDLARLTSLKIDATRAFAR